MKKYRTIVADPPWDIGTIPKWGKTLGQNPFHYPTMTVKEITSLDVGVLADSDSHLYLWTVNKYVKEAYDIALGWGFKPSKLLCWIKNPIGLGIGGTFVPCVEYCLFSTKGKVDAKIRINKNWWLLPRGKHSEKPKEFMSLIESVSHPNYLELFARKRFNNKWDVWGNEVESDIELKQREDI